MNEIFPNPTIPELLKVPNFEQYLVEFKQKIVSHIAQHDENLSLLAKQSLDTESDFAAKMTEACCVIMIERLREENTKALSMFAPFAKGEALDLVVSNLGLKRQVIQQADPLANPPKQEIIESDDRLLLRYYLQPYALKPGSAKGYEFHALTLGEKPQIEVDSTAQGKVVVTYIFSDNSDPGKVSDIKAIRTSPGTVELVVLGRNTIADQSLMDTVEAYIERKDIKEETDLITYTPGTHEDYQIEVNIPSSGLSNPEFIQTQVTSKLQEFADKNRKLAGEVRPEHIGGQLSLLNLTGYQVLQPVNPVATDYTKAPNCTAITVNII